ncbi:TetR/AcrR family transcriptional regulator [Gordonia sp. NPDC003376]
MRKPESASRRRRSRDLLVGAVGELLDAHEPDQITITDVVNHASVTRPTFYAVFPDLPSAFAEAALTRMADAFAGEAAVDVPDARRPDVMLGAITRILTRLAADAGFYTRVVNGHGAHIVQAQAIAFLADELLTNTPVSQALRTGPLPAETSATAIAAGVIWTGLRWLTANPREPVGAMAVELRDLVLRSVIGGLGSPATQPTRDNAEAPEIPEIPEVPDIPETAESEGLT